MTTMTGMKRRAPLTDAQRALVTKWRRLGIKYMLAAIHARGLHHMEDEAEGLAHEALIRAAYVWDGRRAFPACLRVWVRVISQKFSANGARTVRQSERQAHYVDAWSLDAPFTLDNSPGATFADLLEDESAEDPTENMDRRRLLRAVELTIPNLVMGGRVGVSARRNALLSFRLWARRTLDDGPRPPSFDELGAPHRLSRQAVQQRVARVQREFEAWAKPIREEAA